MNSKEAHQLLIRASAIDSRRISEPVVIAWQEVLADVAYEDAVRALIEHRRSAPAVYLEPGHIVQILRREHAREVEIRGPHPAPPPGKRWAADIIDDVNAIDAYAEPRKALS